VSYYDDASLVLIPSGVKTSKVYSQKPTNGTGDLTFSRASTATRTNASGAIETVASNVPRLDYSGGATCPRLLLEPQRTNLLLQSNTFNTTWAFSGTGTVTQGATDPFGGTTAWTLAKTAANTFIFQSTTAISGSTTFSIYAKAGTVDQVYLLHTQTVAFNAFFDLTLGTVVSSANCVATIISVGGGWFRCSISATVAGASNIRIYPASGNSITGTTGNILIYAAQGEGGSFTSTIIPTTTATVTRIVDIAEKFGVGSLIGSPAGTIFLQVQILSLGYSRSFISLQDTSFATNSIRIETTAANRFRIQIRNASTTILDQTVTTGSAFTTGNYKIAYAYDTNTNGVAFYVNGVSLFTTTVASIPTACVNLFLGTRLATIYDLNVSDSFDQALLFKTRLTNAQLAELTTL